MKIQINILKEVLIRSIRLKNHIFRFHFFVFILLRYPHTFVNLKFSFFSMHSCKKR
jgi:hypothetical protein